MFQVPESAQVHRRHPEVDFIQFCILGDQGNAVWQALPLLACSGGSTVTWIE